MANQEILTLKIYFEPNRGEFTTNIEGKASMSTEDLVQILDLLSSSLNDSGYKTVGEYFLDEERSNG